MCLHACLLPASPRPPAALGCSAVPGGVNPACFVSPDSDRFLSANKSAGGCWVLGAGWVGAGVGWVRCAAVHLGGAVRAGLGLGPPAGDSAARPRHCRCCCHCRLCYLAASLIPPVAAELPPPPPPPPHPTHPHPHPHTTSPPYCRRGGLRQGAPRLPVPSAHRPLLPGNREWWGVHA